MRFERNSHFEGQNSCKQYPTIHIVRQRKHTTYPLAVSVVWTVCVLRNIVARSRNSYCSGNPTVHFLVFHVFGKPCYGYNVVIFSTYFIEDISHSNKNSEKDINQCTWVFM